MKKLISLLCAGVMALSLTACGGSGLTAMDASDYVRGMMDLTYYGTSDPDYLKRVGITEEEGRADYEKGLDVEYRYFARYFDMDTELLTEQTWEAIVDLLADFYRQAKYEVKPGSKSGEGFAVEVVVEPIAIIPHVVNTYMEDYSAEFAAVYANIDWSLISPEEEDAFWLTYENGWAMGIVELFREHEGELDYLEPQRVSVEILPDEEGVYSLGESDFANLDALILAYSD